jgi:methyl-accepting chemotaxis protein
LALQLPNTAINNIMTSKGRWKATGLGDSGETYLVGSDEMMRSTSRMVLQDPKRYEKEAVSAGLDPAAAAKAARVKGTILIQTVHTAAARLALQGHTGTTTAKDYLGHESLVSYAPLRIRGLNWGIVAKIDTDEAFAPAQDFAWRMAIATAAIVLLVSIVALLLAQFFVRPVRRLVTGVNQVAAGDLDTQVDASAKDEFGELARAFNQMSRSLRAKQELIEEQQRENDRLLVNLMPEAVAKRYREGEKTISEDHQNVSVLYADLAGFDDFTESMTSARSLDLLNDLVRAFDEAAARIGVEKVRTLRNGYLASCGLTIARVDNARRITLFAWRWTASSNGSTRSTASVSRCGPG